MQFIKNFLDWFNKKPKLHTEKQRPLFQEREVWMCHLGTNIGFELDGKQAELLPIFLNRKTGRVANAKVSTILITFFLFIK